MLRENSKLIASVIEEYIEENDLQDGLLKARIFEAWDLLMIEAATPHFTPQEAKKLTSARYFKDGILSCRMTSSVVRTQLRFELEPLRCKLNTLLQGEYVKQIRLS